ncbi:hypothetical protein LTR78_010858 [Recurvomyces mirabilis]|uniref:Xylanolytic transcriptional activator regulatory domain-containing protein n=1 Tax=Recurvomyces mirabilis TaxID=574656 RepID=A0AAE0TP15_9PEZI|nr:hypothetical protein LTR78_010858 [Recurvomyces mirabilis]
MAAQSSPLDFTTTKDYYNRAKVLFFMGYEKNPMTLVTAVTILQYWNPSGPEHVSIHNSSYWLRVGVGLVHQIGLHRDPKPDCSDRHLRRRIFWTLYARDSLLSAGQGRPRAIHLEDCNVDWPSVADFSSADKSTHAFVAYVKIAGLLGDLAQWFLRGSADAEQQRLAFFDRLCAWAGGLPEELHIVNTAGEYSRYDGTVRSLYLPYLMAVMMLYRPKQILHSFSEATMTSTIAASCVARIFEDALARGEVRDGVAMSAIYLLIAGIFKVGSLSHPLLRLSTLEELRIIAMSLTELAKTWQTATGSLEILQRLRAKFEATSSPPEACPLRVKVSDKILFEPFGPSFSPILKLLDQVETQPLVQRSSDNPVKGGEIVFRPQDQLPNPTQPLPSNTCWT